MKKGYDVYLTDNAYQMLKRYAANTGRSFSQYVAWAALSEMNRQTHRQRHQSAAESIYTGLQANQDSIDDAV